jgi:hypothetical protein
LGLTPLAVMVMVLVATGGADGPVELFPQPNSSTIITAVEAAVAIRLSEGLVVMEPPWV